MLQPSFLQASSPQFAGVPWRSVPIELYVMGFSRYKKGERTAMDLRRSNNYSQM